MSGFTLGSVHQESSFGQIVYGKHVGDNAYIGMDLFDRLFVDGIQLIT